VEGIETEEKIAVLSFDVEQDAPPFMDTTRGMTEGFPRIQSVLEETGVKATFFFTARIAKEFPEAVEWVLDNKHELGSHGWNHERFDQVPKEKAEELIRKSVEVLQEWERIESFRAPNLKFPLYLYPALEKVGIKYSSSQATYKGWRRGITKMENVWEIPATATSLIIRLPLPLGKFYLKHVAGKPLVFFAHPWEFADMSKAPLRWDLRYNTGETAAKNLKEIIEWLKSEGYTFKRLKEVVPSE
jgi:peptidoglycan/xylan/chitin deacetylase (PgdA/CDA1 family)